jgi:hypothetical protein
MAVIFSKIKKKSVKKSSQTILALNCGLRTTAWIPKRFRLISGEAF